MSKFNFVEDTMKKFNAGQPIDFSDRLHDDFMLIREEALVSRNQCFFSYKHEVIMQSVTKVNGLPRIELLHCIFHKVEFRHKDLP